MPTRQHQRPELTAEQFQRIAHLLPGKAEDVGVTADNHRFLNAVFWIARTGSPWRELPESYGNWNSVYQRFNRWAKKGVWERIFHELSKDTQLEWLLIACAILRAQQQATTPKRRSKAKS